MNQPISIFRASFTRLALVALGLTAASVGCGGSDSDSGSAPATVDKTPLIRTGAGVDGAAIQATVDQYRADLGELNANEPVEYPGGRREINWDGVPDDVAAPAFLPGDFFNGTASPRARGAVLSTPGMGVQASADTDNPTSTPVRFGHLNPSYTSTFKTFSGERLFSPVGSNIVDLTFFVAGTTTPAVVRGFGAVYADPDKLESTSFEYFDINDQSLGKFQIPVSNNGLSFLGVSFAKPIVRRVRIAYGQVSLGPDDGPNNDVAVMDDFIYGEPHPVK